MANSLRPQPPLPKRNVFVVDPSGHTIAGFWQYGHSGDSLAMKVLLATDCARTRFPTSSTAGHSNDDYRQRARERDNKCVVTGAQHASYSRLKAAHIFPRSHAAEFARIGFTAQIIDPAPLSAVGGPTKIDSIQNIILLDSSLHDGWDAYEFSIDPDRDYRVTAFINDYSEYDGLHVDFSHTADHRLRPLDDLFRDHFLQGVLKHMKGADEANEEWDPSDDLREGFVDLEQVDKWGGVEGRKALEFVLADKLHTWRINQEDSLS